jgi:hypothetical protein
MRNIHHNVMSQTAEQRDDAVVAASSCPVRNCGEVLHLWAASAVFRPRHVQAGVNSMNQARKCRSSALAQYTFVPPSVPSHGWAMRRMPYFWRGVA